MRKVLMIAVAAALLAAAGCSTTDGAQGASASASAEPVVVKLAAKDATIKTTGAMVLEESSGNVNVGWWETTDDEVSWEATVPADGVYKVAMKYSCDPQFPGSVVDVTVNGQTMTTTIYDTGAWSNYITGEVGTVELKAGTYPVLVKAQKVDNRFVCNLREVSLTLQ